MMDRKHYRLLQAALSQYRSLEQPNFWFQAEAVRKRPYEPLVHELRGWLEVEDMTDLNADVSFVYRLSASGQQWNLMLSMVGPYAVLTQFTEEGETFVGKPTSALEGSITALLARHQLERPPKAALKKPVPLRLNYCEPEDVCMFQALFTDLEWIPF